MYEHRDGSERHAQPQLPVIAACVVAAALAGSALTATAESADEAVRSDARWRPWAELGAVGSSELSYGEVVLFMPWGNETTLGFAELRGKAFTDFDDDDALEGNLAVGVRHMLGRQLLGQHWNVGYWSGADIRRTPSDNEFLQYSTGLELLSADWDLRANAYIPLTDAKAAKPGDVDVQLSGSQLTLLGGQEVPLTGFDAELGWRVPLERWQRERSGLGSVGLGHAQHEWRVYAGGFHFEDGDAAEDVSGPRLRSEWRVLDLIPALPGARLTASFEFAWDEVRKDQWSGGLQLRIPLDWRARSRPQVAALSADARRRRRMSERIVRDVDVLVGRSAREAVALSGRNAAIANVVVVDANNADAEGAIEGAGADSLVIADGSAGAIVALGAIDLNPGQSLVGGGTSLLVEGRRTGVSSTYVVPGVRGAIEGNVSDTTTGLVNAATSASIRSLDITNTATSTGNGIALDGATNVAISDVTITTTDGRGIIAFGGVAGFSAGPDEFTVTGSTINAGGPNGVGIDAGGSARFSVANSAIVLDGVGFAKDGIALGGSSELSLSDSTITTVAGASDGILATGNARFTVTRSTIQTSGPNASPVIESGSGVVFTIDASTLSSSGNDSEGIFASGARGTVLDTDIVTTGTGAHGILAFGPAAIDVRGGSITTTGANADGVNAASVGPGPMGPRTMTILVDGVTIDSAGNGVFLDGDRFDGGRVNGTITSNTITAGGAFDEILVRTDGTATQLISLSGNSLAGGAGTIQLDEGGDDIGVTQAAPGSGATGIDALNGIPTGNVLVPGGVLLLEFDQPAPPLP